MEPRPYLRSLSAVAVALSLMLSACQPAFVPGVALPEQAPDYGKIYPIYAELCALSQFRKRPGFEPPVIGGGFGGHAVLYLNGVCRVSDAHYPVLQMCEAPGPDSGVGISVNAHYKNASWVATEGREFFFHGNLSPGQPLTRETYESAMMIAMAKGVLDGIVFHDEVLAKMPEGETRERYMYDVSVGTDFAIKFARDRYCARVPLTKAQMERTVAFLNDANRPYREGEKEFRWSLFKDNCSHLLRNALAAAGIWEPWPIERPLPISVFSFPVPKNEFVNLARRTNDVAIDDIEAVYRTRRLRESVISGFGLPTRAGALVELDAIAQPNALYDTDIGLIFYDDVVTGRYQRRLDRILREPRYQDPAANRDHFRALYARIERERRPLAWHEKRHRGWGSAERERFAVFYTRYYEWIAAEQATLSDGATAAR